MNSAEKSKIALCKYWVNPALSKSIIQNNLHSTLCETALNKELKYQSLPAISSSVGTWWIKALTFNRFDFDRSINFFLLNSRFSAAEIIFFLGLGFCRLVWGFLRPFSSSFEDVEFDSSLEFCSVLGFKLAWVLT